ncbi:MAG: mechanosensitive ion channel family protein [bacterium]
MDWLTNMYAELSGTVVTRIAVILGIAVLAAAVARLIVFRLLISLAQKTRTGMDDRILLALCSPVVYSCFLVGITLAFNSLDADTLDPTLVFVATGLMKTIAVFIWASAALNIGSIFLGAMSRNHEKLAWIQPKTLPVLRITWKVLVIGALCYFILVAWKINVTSWVASAGVLGIAVGFAAKDTLANLFAGVFILADAPYRIGDFVVLDNGVRGQVTDIGVRSSRLLTRDDIEVTVPNAVIANGDIINETGGRFEKMRVRLSVLVAYGCDLDRVREILLECADGVRHICPDPDPRVRVREFADSGIRCELLAWIDEPVFRGRVLDAMHVKVYKALREEGIEIPYLKRDIYIKEMPASCNYPH